MNIKKLTQNKPFLIGILCSIIFISSIVVIGQLILPTNSIDYYAIDDINIVSTNSYPFNDNNKITYNTTSLIVGWSYTGSADTHNYDGFFMRFDISKKPLKWEKCEISLYCYGIRSNGASTGRIWLFEGNWTEREWDGSPTNYMRNMEIYWKSNDYIDSIGGSGIGFRRFDISEYINIINTTTFSIAVLGGRSYPEFTSTFYGNKYYSSEWDGADFPFILPENDSFKNYLPQLIWS